MPKKATSKKQECTCDTCCPLGRFFSRFEEHNHKDMPEFMNHFMNAHKEVLMGLREMIDWKIEKIEKKTKKRESKRVQRVEIK
jgi:hypothetical protein